MLPHEKINRFLNEKDCFGQGLPLTDCGIYSAISLLNRDKNILDKTLHYKYFLTKCGDILSEDQQEDLERVIVQHLPVEDKEDIMRTIAQKYREEGKLKGRQEGMQLGEEKVS